MGTVLVVMEVGGPRARLTFTCHRVRIKGPQCMRKVQRLHKLYQLPVIRCARDGRDLIHNLTMTDWHTLTNMHANN